MNAAAFARYLGITPAAVYYYINKGILKKSINRNGRSRYEINAKKAKEELSRNKDIIAGGDRRVKKARAKTKTKKTKAKITKKQIKETTEKAGVGEIDFHTARTLNERYKAALKKLEYEEKTQKLIPSDEIKRLWHSHISAAKIKLLGIRSEITPIVRDIVSDMEISETILQAVDNKIEDILTELARAKLN